MKKVDEYATEEIKNLKNKMIEMMAGSAILILFGSVLVETNGFNGTLPESACHNYMLSALGATLGVLGLNNLHLLGVLDKISEWKKNRKRNKH